MIQLNKTTVFRNVWQIYSDQNRQRRWSGFKRARPHRARRIGESRLVAINTDVNSLTSSVATRKVQLGRNVSRGLGAGGDPDVGYQAALESADEFREALADARVIFICAGLGGGTGSGAAPYIAQAAREAGALVIAFATLPFGFEGKRRNVQAREALVRLSEFAEAVICFENDLMGDLVPRRREFIRPSQWRISPSAKACDRL